MNEYSKDGQSDQKWQKSLWYKIFLFLKHSVHQIILKEMYYSCSITVFNIDDHKKQWFLSTNSAN